MNKILLGTLLFPLCWPRRRARPSVRQGERRRRKPSSATQDAGLAALDNETVSPLSQGDCRVLPSSETERAIPARLDQRAQRLLEGGRPAPSALKSYQIRITELQIKGGQLRVPTPVDYQCGKTSPSPPALQRGQAARRHDQPEREDNQQVSPMRPQRQRRRYEGKTSALWTKGATPGWKAPWPAHPRPQRIPGS